jgi:hypothetical protein
MQKLPITPSFFAFIKEIDLHPTCRLGKAEMSGKPSSQPLGRILGYSRVLAGVSKSGLCNTS